MKFSMSDIFVLALVSGGVILTVILGISLYCACSELLDQKEMRKIKIEQMKKNGIDITCGAC
jgi:hypothetical protein